MLRALAAVDVFVETDDGRFTHSPMSEALRSDHPRSVRPTAVLIGQEHLWETWGTLMHSVRTGENAFVGRYGTDVWTYRNERPEQNAIFDAAMSGNTAALADELGGLYDFSDASTVVDLGGGDGTLLLGVLASNPHLSGVLFDQPGVIARARAVLAHADASEAAERCTLVEGTIFGDHPEGGDVYVMRHILHDWTDGDCAAILERCRQVLTGSGVLLVLERVLEGPNEGAHAKFSDLNMLVMPGGRERSEAQFADLFAAAGLRLQAASPGARRGVDPGGRPSLIRCRSSPAPGLAPARRHEPEACAPTTTTIATATTTTRPPNTIAGVTASDRISQPRNTATTGLTYA